MKRSAAAVAALAFLAVGASQAASGVSAKTPGELVMAAMAKTTRRDLKHLPLSVAEHHDQPAAVDPQLDPRDGTFIKMKGIRLCMPAGAAHVELVEPGVYGPRSVLHASSNRYGFFATTGSEHIVDRFLPPGLQHRRLERGLQATGMVEQQAKALIVRTRMRLRKETSETVLRRVLLLSPRGLASEGNLDNAAEKGLLATLAGSMRRTNAVHHFVTARHSCYVFLDRVLSVDGQLAIGIMTFTREGKWAWQGTLSFPMGPDGGPEEAFVSMNAVALVRCMFSEAEATKAVDEPLREAETEAEESAQAPVSANSPTATEAETKCPHDGRNEVALPAHPPQATP